MSEERYYVASCTGVLWRGTYASAWGNKSTALGMTANVLDRHFVHRVVASFRSEDLRTNERMERRHDRVLLMAQELADRLNAEDMDAAA